MRANRSCEDRALLLVPTRSVVPVYQAAPVIGQEDNVKIVLLVGCLSLSACAAVVTSRLRSLEQKLARFAPIYYERDQS